MSFLVLVSLTLMGLEIASARRAPQAKISRVTGHGYDEFAGSREDANRMRRGSALGRDARSMLCENHEGSVAPSGDGNAHPLTLCGDSLMGHRQSEHEAVERLIEMSFDWKILETESSVDPDASDLTRLYRMKVFNVMGSVGMRAELVGFACGLDVCLGEFAGGSDREYGKWLVAFSGDQDLSGQQISNRSWRDVRGGARLRFGFATRM